MKNMRALFYLLLEGADGNITRPVSLHNNTIVGQNGKLDLENSLISSTTLKGTEK